MEPAERIKDLEIRGGVGDCLEQSAGQVASFIGRHGGGVVVVGEAGNSLTQLGQHLVAAVSCSASWAHRNASLGSGWGELGARLAGASIEVFGEVAPALVFGLRVVGKRPAQLL